PERPAGWTWTRTVRAGSSSRGSISSSGSRDPSPTARSRSHSTAQASRPTCSHSARTRRPGRHPSPVSRTSDRGLADQAPRPLYSRDCFVLCDIAFARSRHRGAVGVDELPVVAAIGLHDHLEVGQASRFLVTSRLRSVVHHVARGYRVPLSRRVVRRSSGARQWGICGGRLRLLLPSLYGRRRPRAREGAAG